MTDKYTPFREAFFSPVVPPNKAQKFGGQAHMDSVTMRNMRIHLALQRHPELVEDLLKESSNVAVWTYEELIEYGKAQTKQDCEPDSFKFGSHTITRYSPGVYAITQGDGVIFYAYDPCVVVFQGDKVVVKNLRKQNAKLKPFLAAAANEDMELDGINAASLYISMYGLEPPLKIYKNDEERDLCYAVDAFAKAMRDKLLKKHAEGRRGWKDQEWLKDPEGATALLFHLLEKGDPVDIANVLMFLYTGGLKLVVGKVEPNKLGEMVTTASNSFAIANAELAKLAAYLNGTSNKE